MPDEAEKPKKLTPRQERFVQFYVGESHFNASDAARRCGYKDFGNEGWRLRKVAAIVARIDEILDARALSSAEILSELADVASAEWRDFVSVKTNPKTGKVIEVKMDLSNKVKALELLGKNKKLFTDKLEQSGEVLIRDYGPGDEAV